MSNIHADWLLRERGIEPSTLERFGVRSEGKELILPYGGGIEKRRLGIPDGERKMWMVGLPQGAPVPLFNGVKVNGSESVWLVEGETDCMRLDQEFRAAGLNMAVCAVGGVNTFDPRTLPVLEKAGKVFVCFDNDPDYMVQSQVKAALFKVRAALEDRYRPVILPRGTKDICEFLQRYSLADLKKIVDQSVEAQFVYQALALDREPLPTRWLVDDTLAAGDIHVLVGEPGVGKSWLTLDLAAAIACRRGVWLGRKLHTKTGRVLYVDEENPPDLVHTRMRRLGLTPDDAKHIRYLSHQGVRLDRDPEKFMEECVAYGPDLIIIDSLSGVHSQDENNNMAMRTVVRDGVRPVALQTGAAVIILHHVGKGDAATTFVRARGAGDISASPDTTLDYREGAYADSLVVGKSRRLKQGEPLNIARVDQPDGSIKLVANPPSPF